MKMQRALVSELTQDILSIIWELYKILIPLIVVIKLLQDFGAVDIVAQWLAPFMHPLGLPPEMGLVWATAMIVNLYGGLVVFVQLAGDSGMSVAQVSVISLLMLCAHNLLVELRITQKLGASIWFLFVLRVVGGYLMGWIAWQLLTAFDFLSDTAVILWTQQEVDSSWLDWAQSQGVLLAQIAVIIAALVIVLRFVKWIGLEALLTTLFTPLFRLMGMRPEMTSFTLIGWLLGLAYGGGILLREAVKQGFEAKQIFLAVALLSLSHSLVEDTILVLLIGADVWVVLGLRVIFSVGLMLLLVLSLRTIPPAVFEKYFCKTLSSNNQS